MWVRKNVCAEVGAAGGDLSNYHKTLSAWVSQLAWGKDFVIGWRRVWSQVLTLSGW